MAKSKMIVLQEEGFFLSFLFSLFPVYVCANYITRHMEVNGNKRQTRAVVVVALFFFVHHYFCMFAIMHFVFQQKSKKFGANTRNI